MDSFSCSAGARARKKVFPQVPAKSSMYGSTLPMTGAVIDAGHVDTLYSFPIRTPSRLPSSENSGCR